MPLPSGFVWEDQATKPDTAQHNLPAGFVPENAGEAEIRTAPPRNIWGRVEDFFSDPDKRAARAQNIYSLSKVTGLPLHEVNKNYDMLRFSTDITGMEREPTSDELLQGLMIPGVVAGAVANPIGTAAGLVAFMAIDKAIPTDKLIDAMEEKGIDDTLVQTVELADFVGKGMLAGGVYHKARNLPEMVMKRKITEYRLPETVHLTPEQVKNIYNSGQMTTPEQQQLWASLELNSWDRRAALEHGIRIEVPAEKIVRIADRPFWGKMKSWFGSAEEGTVTRSLADTPKKAPKGLLEAPKTQGQAGGPITPENAAERFIGALKRAKSVRSKQETIYEKERAKKFAKLQSARSKAKGEKGFFKELGALKGEMSKVEFESIRNEVGQEGIDALFQAIRESPNIGEWEKINAMTGLSKMLGAEGGKVPTEGEIILLREVFGEKFTKAVMEKRTLYQKVKNAVLQLANVPRSIMSSFDLSAPLRQGIFFIGRQKQFGPAFKKMFGAFLKEKSYTAVQDSIIAHPYYQIARESRLALTDLKSALTLREESFMSSWAEKIPLVGRGVRASGRAYIAFLNKLRFDVFVDMVNKAVDLKLDPLKDRDIMRAIADFINNATGRGTLPGSLQKAAVTLNTIFFSPRLIFSRLNLLNPVYYIKLNPFVRKEALKSLFGFVGLGVTVLSLAKLAGGDVGTEPRSSDFGKIRIRNTRMDVWGGFQPLVRAASQIITGKYVSSTTGKEITLGEGYRPMTRADIIQRVIEGKLAPVPSFIMTLLKQQEPGTGEPVNPPKELATRFIPMLLQDMYELATEDPQLLPAMIAAAFGVGVQTYRNKRKTGF